MAEQKVEYKSLYTAIFSGYYFVEGLNISILAVIVPIYILSNAGTIGAGMIGELGSIVMLPWAIKFIYGMLGDRIGIKKFGRRRIWIIIPGIIGGIGWAITPILLLNAGDLYVLFLTIGIIGGFGFAIGDTSLDGLTLDICPPEMLGRVQGFCWGFRSVGRIAGGPLMTLAIFLLGMEIEVIFSIFGIATIFFSLLTILVKEPPIPERIEMERNIKDMFKGEKNWKLYLHSTVYNLTEGVFFVYLSLYVLILIGLVTPEGADLNILEEDIDLYVPQAYINLIIGFGIIAGALVGGYLADKASRRLSAYISYAISLISVILLFIKLNEFMIVFVLILTGASLGWRNASYSPILGEFANDYPQMDSTYFSIGNSFSNIGSTIGLAIVSMLFDYYSTIYLDFNQIYRSVFIGITIMIAIAPITFSLINPKYYEPKKKYVKVVDEKNN